MTTKEQIVFSRMANKKMNCLMLTEGISESKYATMDLFSAVEEIKKEKRLYKRASEQIYLDKSIFKIYDRVMDDMDEKSVRYIIADVEFRNKLFEEKYLFRSRIKDNLQGVLDDEPYSCPAQVLPLNLKLLKSLKIGSFLRSIFEESKLLFW